MAEARPKTNPKKRGKPKRRKEIKAPSNEIKLCTAYLYRKDGCDKGEMCDSLHICRNYILKQCNAGGQCPFEHDLQSNQSRALFQRFGIYPLGGEMLHKFKDLFAATLRKTTIDESLGEEESKKQREVMKRQNKEMLTNFLQSFADTSTVSTPEQPPPTGTKPQVQQKSFAETSPKQLMSISTRPQFPAEKQPEICQFFLRGHCKFTEQMHMHPNHVHYSSPFQWQIRDDAVGVWLDFMMQQNIVVEEFYCDVACINFTGVIIADSGRHNVVMEDATITFDTDCFTATDNKAGSKFCVRRLSTISHTIAKPWQMAYSTHWIWYRLGNNKAWFECQEETSEGDHDDSLNSSILERSYQNFKNWSGPSMLDVSPQQWKCTGRIDLSRMVWSSSVDGHTKQLPMARRPRHHLLPDQHRQCIPAVRRKNAPNQYRIDPTQPDVGKVASRPTHPAEVGKVASRPTHPVEVGKVASRPTHPAEVGKVASRPTHPAEVGKVASRPTHPAEVGKVASRPTHPAEVPEVPVVSFPKNTTSMRPTSPGSDRKEVLYICPYFLRGRCKYVDDKYNHKRHFKTPYQWQFQNKIDGSDWVNLTVDGNDTIEESFCDVTNSLYNYCLGEVLLNCYTVLTIRFDENTMLETTSDFKIRRLSTSSSVLNSNWETAFSTEWMWYWCDETGKWNLYADQNAKGGKASIDSATIEQKFIDFERKHGESVIEFTAGGQQYKLDMTLMHQTNVQYGTCRQVRRRPKFVPMAERKRLSREVSEAERSGAVVPTSWDNRGSQRDMELVALTTYSPEYRAIAKLFLNTMDTKGSIISIERIQNMELWEDFSKMRVRMKKKNGEKPISQMQLFHGTSTKTDAEAICRQNFDWRLSGSNVGARYGKGSYFARDAKFAHSYTKASDMNHRYLLVAQVLVGTYTTGDTTYVRPPPKNRLQPHGDMYDSCVNNIANPEIFVIFEKTQAYPEYLVKYKEKSSYQTTAAGSSWSRQTGHASVNPQPSSYYAGSSGPSRTTASSHTTSSNTQTTSTPKTENKCTIQ